MEEVEQQLQENLKSCLEDGHQGFNYIVMICLDQDCQRKSKTLCIKCVLQGLHKDCKITLLCKDCRYSKFQLCQNQEANKLNDYYEYLNTQHYKEIERVEKVFQQIEDKFLDQINKIKKEEKIKIHEYYDKVENNLKHYFNFFNRYQNIGNIQEIENRVEQYNDIEQLNEFIQEYQQYKFFSSYEVEQISQIYQQSQQLEQEIKKEIEKLELNIDNNFSQLQQKFLHKLEIYNPLFMVQYDMNDNGGYQLYNGQFLIKEEQNLNVISRKVFNKQDNLQVKIISKSNNVAQISLIVYVLKLEDYELTSQYQFVQSFDFNSYDEFVNLVTNVQENKFQYTIKDNKKINYESDFNLDSIQQYQIKVKFINLSKYDFKLKIE